MTLKDQGVFSWNTNYFSDILVKLSCILNERKGLRLHEGETQTLSFRLQNAGIALQILTVPIIDFCCKTSVILLGRMHQVDCYWTKSP